VPEGDILLHAGDLTGHGTLPNLRAFLRWFTALPHPHKAFVAGNHDLVLDPSKNPGYGNSLNAPPGNPDYAEAKALARECGAHYLYDSEVTLLGLRIYGSPFQPPFYNWAFQREEGELARRWARIPAGIDVLVTHGPARGYGDQNLEGEHCGSTSLQAHLQQHSVLLHVFGHIHEAAGEGVYPWGGRWVNASVLNRAYRLANLPRVVELEAGVCL
jgi:Icc-related predicted phosphoesterase